MWLLFKFLLQHEVMRIAEIISVQILPPNGQPYLVVRFSDAALAIVDAARSAFRLLFMMRKAFLIGSTP